MKVPISSRAMAILADPRQSDRLAEAVRSLRQRVKLVSGEQTEVDVTIPVAEADFEVCEVGSCSSELEAAAPSKL